ncbi:brassinosteroid LRR receptor kinase-like [Solanum tuberosum]|uniref:brassinosteroid LRR receptor kinase-like n=1 Tax=Solanum tuberosum TaxID=4113 RepID=UPI00073A21AF|nr:PREDICTED: brassinosteroid LRR receptor kinase-like [Solanum tuberosum]
MYVSSPIDCSSQVLVGEPVIFSLCSFIGLDPLLPLTHSEDRKLATFQLIRSEAVPFFGISEILKSFEGAITDSVRLCKPKYEGLFQIRQSLIQLFKHAFGDLSFLVSIDLSLNNFHGELPSEFSHLRRLGEVDLSYNNFTGEIPIGLATPPRLKRLSFGFDESLNGSNVLSILSISTLEYLDLGNAGLTGDIPSDLCHHVPRLQALGLDSNVLSGRIPRTISKCSELPTPMVETK